MNNLEFEFVDPGIGVLTFSREKVLNALNEELIREAIELLTQLQEDEDLKVLILTGKGSKAFVAGADIKELESANKDAGEAVSQLGHQMMRLIAELRVPVLAAINGFALGGGLEVALSCDIRYASSKAKLGLPEVTLGLIPGYGGTQRLIQAVGHARAMEYVMTGDMVSAEEALQHGLLQAVHEPEELMEAVLEKARTMASRAPLALRSAKALIRGYQNEELCRGLTAEIQAFAGICDTEDKNEGTTAFLGKRKPVFNGR